MNISNNYYLELLINTPLQAMMNTVNNLTFTDMFIML